jgi:hypothetical protein
MYPPANIINRLGYERRPIVLVEIPAKVSVGPTTNVVRRIAFSLILVKHAHNRRCILPGCLRACVPTTSKVRRSPSDKNGNRGWADHQRDSQGVWLAAVFPTICTQAVNDAAARYRRGGASPAPPGQRIADIRPVTASEAVAIVVRNMGGVVEPPCVCVEIVGTTRPPCLVYLRPEFVGNIESDFCFLDMFAIDFGARVTGPRNRGTNATPRATTACTSSARRTP